MKNIAIDVHTIKTPIAKSPGFAKKGLSEFKLDILGLCAFGCRYCSSNTGNYLRIRREQFADLTEQQTGKRTYPTEDPSLVFRWPEIIENMKAQLANKPKSFGQDKTLVFSMLTDGFSPLALEQGITRQALDLLVAKTSFRIRVLTKNAIVGSPEWIEYFQQHSDRFVVGLSIGTDDDTWAQQIELGASLPSERIQATLNLQEAGISTFGMLCPLFPDMLDGDRLESLVETLQPNVLEHIWAEPFNNRQNWQVVRDGFRRQSAAYRWFTEVYAEGNKQVWSAYATELYTRLIAKANAEGWADKLRYLLYESDVTLGDAIAFDGLNGVLLQSIDKDSGYSKHPVFGMMQKMDEVIAKTAFTGA